MSESEAWGVGFHIDHYYAQKHFASLTHEYSNLMYSCATCNQKKGDEPDPPSTTIRFLRVDEDDPDEHIELSAREVSGISKIGEFTVELLDLNRSSLKTLRRLREERGDSADMIKKGRIALKGLSLDRYEPAVRFSVAKIRNDLLKRDQELAAAGAAANAIDEEGALLELNRSPLLDEDPAAKARAKARRAYLKALKAAVP